MPKCKRCGKDLSDQPLKDLLEVCHECSTKQQKYPGGYELKKGGGGSI